MEESYLHSVRAHVVASDPNVVTSYPAGRESRRSSEVGRGGAERLREREKVTFAANGALVVASDQMCRNFRSDKEERGRTAAREAREGRSRAREGAGQMGLSVDEQKKAQSIRRQPNIAIVENRASGCCQGNVRDTYAALAIVAAIASVAGAYLYYRN
ncbi:hypothetical protein MA16_Dca018643 [Dendrobium catenatum]|uniref:Uncharacterized protein n=1 Tax=Dendrobium catenatum TaxID=906689 RepID=A0A2I0W5U6_9ASPA|nr:hypothetical protein MA16_Dca018643 [Dendrobium catenatum]